MRDVKSMLMSTSWQIKRVSLVNWGCYDGGPYVVDMSTKAFSGDRPGLTIITGDTGAGKSTIMDALIVLLLRSGTPLNKASANESRSGTMKRGIYSYGKGYQGNQLDDRGNERARYLRGERLGEDGQLRRVPVWSAISCELEDTLGSVVTVAGFFWIAADDDKATSCVWLLAEGVIDLAAVEPVTNARFTKSAIGQVYGQAAVVSDNKEDMRRELHAITGSNLKSETLLYRILTSSGATNVTSTFRETVLEVPATIQCAEDLVKDVSNIDESIAHGIRELRKNDRLVEIDVKYAEYQTLLEEQLVYSTWAVSQGGPNASDEHAFSRWFARKVSPYINGAVERTSARVQEIRKSLLVNGQELVEATRRRDELSAEYYQSGGAGIDAIREHLRVAMTKRDERKAKVKLVRTYFTNVGEELPSDERSWRHREDVARNDFETYSERKASLDKRKNAILDEGRTAASALGAAQERLSTAEVTGTRISSEMHAARQLIARHMAIATDRIVFAGEVMDLRPEEEDWRLAANLCFAHDADRLIIPKQYKRAWDSGMMSLEGGRLRRRYHADFVEEEPYSPCEHDSGSLSSRLKFDTSSPYAAWLERRLSDARHDYSCLDDDDVFSKTSANRREVKRNGLVSQGSKASHGYSGKGPDLIGFSDERYTAQLREAVARAKALVEQKKRELDELDEEMRCLDAEKDLYNIMSTTQWLEVDVATAEHQVTMYERQLADAENDDKLRSVKQRLDEASSRVSGLEQEKGRLDTAQKSATTKLTELKSHQGQVERDAVTREDTLEVSYELGEQLELIWARVFTGESDEMALTNADGYRNKRRQVRDGLVRCASDARSVANGVAAGLTALLRSFKEEYGEEMPELAALGIDAVDAPYYIQFPHGEDWKSAVLDDRAQAIERLVNELQQFMDMGAKYENDVNEILGKVGDILMGYDYDTMGSKLVLLPRFREGAEYSRFRDEARSILRAEFTVHTVDDYRTWSEGRQEELLDRFRALATLLKNAGKSNNIYADPRVRFVIKALVEHPDGTTMVISDYGSSSGGEKEKTMAFVFGAAMTYMLGNSNDTLPSFAPLLFDEGFVRSDVQTTRLAVDVLRGLGFQLIVSCPDQKMGAIEPIAERAWFVRKDDDGRAILNTEVMAD
jgi:uncharacterized protein YPO0396